MRDNKLIRIYMLGVKDELYGEEHRIYQTNLQNSAYLLGRADGMVGEDVSTIDLQTDEQILKRIIDNT
jgi:hypothetical protein